MTASSEALAARELVVVRNGRRVLDGAHVTLARGTIATLEGASGAGKTTLLRVLARLLPPTAGTLTLAGTPAAQIPPRDYRVKVAYVPQQPAMFDGTVADNVEAGPVFRGFGLVPGVIDALLEQAGVEGFAERRAADLSAGEKQRVALARALANAPTVLLLDEPTAALDPAAAERLRATLRELASAGLALLVVTHTVAEVEQLGGTRYRLEGGRVVSQGSAS